VREQIEAMTKRSLAEVGGADFELQPERTQSAAGYPNVTVRLERQ